MLSYQHIYHAGSFADVQKHALLVRLLTTLRARPARLHVLDTHAGRGFYDLGSAEAQKTGEHQFGITPLWMRRDDYTAGSLIGDYLQAVERHNKGAALSRYPGSARIARDLLRPTDMLIAAERHPREFQELAHAFRHENPDHTDLFHDDGLQGLTEAAPPGNTTGLVVIDPSYEIKTEYGDIARQLVKAWRYWPQATALLWYPILASNPHHELLQVLQRANIPQTLISEIRLTVPPKPGYRMEGSGIVIINCPWPEMEMVKMSGEIAKALQHGCGKVMADALALGDLSL